MQAEPERFPDVYVRPATGADLDAAAKIIGDTPVWREHLSLTQLRAQTLLEGVMERKEGLIVAESGGQVVGVAWFITRGAFGRSGYMRLLTVREDWRNSHAGAALLQAVESATGDDLFLMVPEFNTDALRFYKRHGYDEVGRLPGYVRPTVSELLLWRRK